METTPTSHKSYTAGLLVIGNEILSGRTQDLNVQFLGETLSRHGIELKEVRILPDEEEILVTEITEIKPRYDYIFTTGGIGPTHDDITVSCIARALGIPLIEDEEALRRLKAHYKDELTPERAKMAMVPFGSHLIDNPVTSAPGFYIENIYVLAGVPRIMRAMLMSLLPTLKGGPALVSKSISCLLGEGILAKDLEKLQLQHPHVDIGSYPFWRPEGHGTTLVVRGKNSKIIERVHQKTREMILTHGGVPEEDVNLLFTYSSEQKNLPPLSSSCEQTETPKSFLASQETKKLILGGLLIAGLCVAILGIWGWTQSPSVKMIKKPILSLSEAENFLKRHIPLAGTFKSDRFERIDTPALSFELYEGSA